MRKRMQYKMNIGPSLTAASQKQSCFSVSNIEEKKKKEEQTS